LSHSLADSDIPTIASLGTLVATITEGYAVEPMELFAFSNFVAITNTNGGINNGVAPFNTFLTSWGAGYSWDTKASFSWGLGDVIDQYTYQTTHLEFNPSIDVYAYLHGYFTMTSAYAMLSFSANVSPFDITPIEFDVLVPTTSLGVCFGISSQS
jgi:hypothetical protein